ncbi:MAG: hypothetical protein NVS3B20_19880 [Polyangiales bacterium]
MVESIELIESIESINGPSFNSPERAIEAYAQFKNARQMTVALSRGGKSMVLHLTFR